MTDSRDRRPTAPATPTRPGALADEAWAVSHRRQSALRHGDRRSTVPLGAPAERRRRDRSGRAGALARSLGRGAGDPRGRAADGRPRDARRARRRPRAPRSGCRGGVDRWAVDPLDGPQVTFLNVAELPAADDGRRRRGALSSAGGRWGRGSTATSTGLRAAAADGLSRPRALVDSVVDELDDLLEAGADDVAARRPRRGRAGRTGPRRRRPAFRRRDRWRRSATTIRPGVRRAIERSSSTSSRPIARPDDRPGLAHVPGGEEAYAPPRPGPHDTRPRAGGDPRHRPRGDRARIDARVRRARRIAARARRRPRPRSPGSATTRRSGSRPATRSGQTAEACARDGRTTAIPGWFGRLPEAACEVVVMGDHESRHSTIAYYRQPAADGSRPGQLLHQHLAARDAAALRGRGRSPSTRRSPATISRSRSPRS